MKKLLSASVGIVTVLSAFSVSVGAAPEQKLPFELTAPQNVSIVYLEGRDSANTCEIHYSQNNSMSEWSTRKENDYDAVMKELGELGYDDLWITAQIDWSIDSQDDWHYNPYWDTEGYDENYVQKLGDWAYIGTSYSSETSMSEWIFGYMGNIDDPQDRTWYGDYEEGNYYGWKDVLKEGQYEVVKGDGESYAKIDYTKHTIYTRVRWLVTCRENKEDGKDIKIASEWSETAAVGKDAEKTEPIKAGDVSAPVIKDLTMTDGSFSEYPVIAFRLEVDDKLEKQAAQLTGTMGNIFLCTEARVQGKEDWVELQGDFAVKSGDLQIELQNLAEAEGEIKKDTPIEIRARYLCMPSGSDDFYSDYSNVLTFGSEEMKVPDESSAEISEESADETSSDISVAASQQENKQENKCSLCGFCPHPLGICIFIWLAVVIVIAVVVAVIVIRKKKSSK